MPYKKVYKKAVAFVVLLAVMLTLSGCAASLDMTNDEFLSPPRARGEMYEIDKVLKQSVKGKFTLRYPTDGEYRSAYVLTNLTGGETTEFALAFYSVLNTENIATMHLNLMKKTGDNWISISDISVSAVGVEKVDIIDLNNDDIKEIVVGWNIYGGVDKRVMVYSLKGLSLIPRIQEIYTEFMCCELKSDNQKGLFILEHNKTESTASAKYFTFDASGVRELGSCDLDGSATSFSKPILSKLTSGKPAIFVDETVGSGMQTEIIYFKGQKLLSPLYQKTPQTVLPTYRNEQISCMDIDGDEVVEVPLRLSDDEFVFNSTSPSLNPITRWCTYNGSEFKTSMYAAMNYTDGYFLEIPQKWLNIITISRDAENRLRTIYLWEDESETVLGELVRIRTISDVEWDKENNGFSEYAEILRSEGLVYAAMFGNYYGPEKIDKNELKKLFHLLG